MGTCGSAAASFLSNVKYSLPPAAAGAVAATAAVAGAGRSNSADAACERKRQGSSGTMDNGCLHHGAAGANGGGVTSVAGGSRRQAEARRPAHAKAAQPTGGARALVHSARSRGSDPAVPAMH